jgi:hypothetical protein
LVRIILLLLIIVGSACDPEIAVQSPTIVVPVAGLTDKLFPSRRTIYPEQNDSILVAASGAIEIGKSGTFLVPDMSEGNVKHYSRDGRLIRVIGRKGRGPGEFMTPYFARFVRDSVLVADLAYHPTMSLFSPDGVFQSSFVLRAVATLQGLHLLTNGNMLLLAHSTDRKNEHVLFEVSRTGGVVRELLPIRYVRPTGSAPDPNDNWAPFRTSFLALNGDSAYVVNTLSDSIWTVSLETGAYKQLRLQVGRLELPTEIPADASLSLSAMADFAKRFHRTSGVFAWQSNVIVSFARGDPDTDDVITAFRRPDGSWSATTGKPRFVAAGHGILAGLLDIGDSLRIDFVDRNYK